MRMWQPVGPSKTKVSFRSYYWNSDFDGTNTRGEGTLNWKGTVTNCGGGSNAGIRCYGNTQGDSGFSGNPNGGAGCRKRLSTRWTGTMHWYVRPAVALAKMCLVGSRRHVSACVCLRRSAQLEPRTYCTPLPRADTAYALHGAAWPFLWHVAASLSRLH